MRGSRYLGVLALALAAAVFFAGGVASAKTASGPNCGDTVNGNVVLTQDLNCPSTDGLDVGSSLTTIHLNGHKIVCINDALPCNGDSGIYTVYNNTTIVGPGWVSGFGTQIDVESDVNTVMNLSTSSGASNDSTYGVYIEGSSNQVIKVTDTKDDYSFYDDGGELANTFLNNTSNGAHYNAFYNNGSSMDLFQGNAAFGAGSDAFYDDGGDHTTYKQNKSSHGGDDGFESYCSTYNTYTQNTSVANYNAGFDFLAGDCQGDHFDGAPVTATWNLAKGNGEDGFYTDKTDSYEGADGLGSWLANNSALGNGFRDGGVGFDSYRTYLSTWAHNVSNGNAYEGYYINYPAADTVTGNTGNGNHDSGVVFDHTGGPCGVSGPFHFCDPQMVANNTGVHNWEFGFWADHIVASSLNVAHNNATAPIDCVNVICVAHLSSTNPAAGPFLIYKHSRPDVSKVEAAQVKPAAPQH